MFDWLQWSEPSFVVGVIVGGALNWAGTVIGEKIRRRYRP